MRQTPTYRLVDDRLKGALADQLQLWQECKVSVPAMARLLAAATAVEVSAETVRRWLPAKDSAA